MYGVIFFFAFLLAIAWIYVFPVIVHYDLSIPELFTVTLRSGFISLSGLIMQLLFAGIIVMLIYKLPALFVVFGVRSEEHTSELQSRGHLVCRLLLEKKKRYY